LKASWRYLSTAHTEEIARRKFSGDSEVERMVELSEQTRAIFRRGFWPAGVGSESRAPIFIVGMMR
jgi:hypothetical protein